MAMKTMLKSLSRLLGVITLLPLLALCAVAQAPAPAPTEAQKAARLLLELTLTASHINAVAASLGQSTIDKSRIDAYLKKVLDDAAEIYASRFTVDEMKTAIDFYQSPAGKKFIELSPALIRDINAVAKKHSGELKAPTSQRK